MIGNSVSKCNKHHSLRFNCVKILVSFTGLALIPTDIKHILYGREKKNQQKPKHSCMALSAPIERTFQQQSSAWAGVQITQMAKSLMFSEGMSSNDHSLLLSPAQANP